MKAGEGIGVVYVCTECGKRMPLEEVSKQWKCTECGCRILRKARAPIVRRVKAV